MKELWPIDELVIVGYAEALTPTALPFRVPPVYRVRADAGRFLVPPFVINAGHLYNATEIGAEELRDLQFKSALTLFDDELSAQPGHELWIGVSGERHYEPWDTARRNLRRIAEEAIPAAEEAMREGNLEEAERFACRAACADPRRAEPLAIKAAIRRLEGNEEGVRLMARLAASALGPASFENLVGGYTRMRGIPIRRSAMSDLACRKAA